MWGYDEDPPGGGEGEEGTVGADGEGGGVASLDDGPIGGMNVCGLVLNASVVKDEIDEVVAEVCALE